MKKKLLITMGCSFTEGVGCYDYSKMSSLVKYTELNTKERVQQLSNFHELGWPNLVGKELGFDKVINIGLAGSSNREQFYRFMGFIFPKLSSLKQEYETYLIWLMTEPSRFSFASENKFVTFIPNNKHLFSLPKAYMEDYIRLNFSPVKEQSFLMQQSEVIFKSLGINYIFSSWNKSFTTIHSIFSSDRLLTPYPHFFNFNFNSDCMSKVCRHPNDKGYKRLAIEFLELINFYHPDFNVGYPKDNFSWIFLGRDAKGEVSKYLFFEK